MRLSWIFALVCTGAIGAFAGVSAEITLSSSNTLDEEVNAQIVTMLGQELSVMRRAPSTRLRALAEANPNQVRRAWIFGRRQDEDSAFKYSEASLARLPTAYGGEEWSCLSEALYFEARGESVEGQFAVAEVIMNRADSRSFPSSVCSVVREGSGRGLHNCQFSYNCDGQAEVVSERSAFDQVAKVAKIMLDGEPRVLTKGATYYHTIAVNPSWARSFTQTAKIGVHKFYRDNRDYSSN